MTTPYLGSSHVLRYVLRLALLDFLDYRLGLGLCFGCVVLGMVFIVVRLLGRGSEKVNKLFNNKYVSREKQITLKCKSRTGTPKTRREPIYQRKG
jgi:hypothetical protein